MLNRSDGVAANGTNITFAQFVAQSLGIIAHAEFGLVVKRFRGLKNTLCFSDLRIQFG